MDEKMDVDFLPEVIDELNELVEILYEKEYFNYKESAVEYVVNIINHTQQTVYLGIGKKAPVYFLRYGATHYITYRPNKRTSWYILFEYKDDHYLIDYITNNHSKGQHIRGLK